MTAGWWIALALYLIGVQQAAAFLTVCKFVPDARFHLPQQNAIGRITRVLFLAVWPFFFALIWVNTLRSYTWTKEETE